MFLAIISVVITFVAFKLIAGYCDKHNIDIPDGEYHSEWEN